MKIKLLCSMSAVCCLVGCGSTSVSTPKEELLAPDCTHKDAPTVAAPMWVCDVPIEGYAKTAVGFSEKRPTVSMTAAAATAQARTKMASEFATDVSEVMQEYQKSVNTDEEDMYMIDLDLVRQTFTSASLFGSKVVRTLTSPNQGQYVVIAMDEETYEANKKKLMAALIDEDARMKKMFEDDKAKKMLMDLFVSK
jgi:hypothetical protein